MDRPNPLQQRRIGDGVRRGRPPPPGVKAGLGRAEHARHHRDREEGLVRAHELEDPDGIAPVSRANQAAARERMSRSTRSCLFSRRSRASSSRSATLNPSTFSSRRPSSWSACATQLRIAGTTVRTPGKGRSDRARTGPDRPSGGETQANRAVVFSASRSLRSKA